MRKQNAEYVIRVLRLDRHCLAGNYQMYRISTLQIAFLIHYPEDYIGQYYVWREIVFVIKSAV